MPPATGAGDIYRGASSCRPVMIQPARLGSPRPSVELSSNRRRKWSSTSRRLLFFVRHLLLVIGLQEGRSARVRGSLGRSWRRSCATFLEVTQLKSEFEPPLRSGRTTDDVRADGERNTISHVSNCFHERH
jgi:hypothetical protein